MSGSREIRKKASEEKYTLVAPLDYMLLGFLPEEGQLAFGLYPLGESVIALRKKFTPEQQKHITTTAISGRLVSMNFQGLTTNVLPGAGDKKVWQRTVVGTQVLNKWKGANGSSSGGTDG